MLFAFAATIAVCLINAAVAIITFAVLQLGLDEYNLGRKGTIQSGIQLTISAFSKK